MPELSFEVWCSCGNGLCYQTKVKGSAVTVEPCETCLTKANESGHQKGYDSGYDKGYDEGYSEGHDAGLSENKPA